MRRFFIILLKFLRVLLALVFLSIVLLWFLDALLEWNLNYLEPLSVFIAAFFSGIGAAISNLGAKQLQGAADQSLTNTGDVGPFAAVGHNAQVNTAVRGDLVQGDKHETHETVYGDKFTGDKVMGDLIQQQTIYHAAQAKEPPLQIPETARYFQGREELIAAVLAELQPGRVISLIGIGGIGKTAVTAEVVRRMLPAEGPPQRFPDGIIFYSFYGQPKSNLALQHILNSLDVDRPGPLEDNIRAALSGKKLLLILDGTEEADDLARVVNLRSSSAILISSRKNADVFDKDFAVERLQTGDSETLLTLWAGDRVHDRHAAREICEYVGHLPLAVRLAGKYMATRGLMAGEYLDWLQSTGLNALDFGERRRDSVPVQLNKSIAQVDDRAQQALAVAGSLAMAPFAVEPVAAALQLSTIDTHQALGDLVNYGLLQRPLERYALTHPLVHSFARKEMNVDQETLLRLTAYYTRFAREESGQGLEGFAKLDHERSHIMQLIKICEQKEQWPGVNRLVWAVDDYLDRRGYGVERIEVIKSGIRAAQATGDRRGEGNRLGSLGSAYFALGQVAQAINYYQQALTIAKDIGDRRGAGVHLGNLGSAYRNLGQAEQAIDYYQQALAIAKDIGDKRGVGTLLGNLGSAYRNLGQVEQAIGYYQQALAIAKDIGDRRGEGNRLGNLGSAYADQEDVEKARDYYQQALAIAKDIGDRRSEGAHLGNLGSAYRNLGQVEQAIDYHQRALAIAKEIDDKRGEGALLGNLGKDYAKLGKEKQAINYYKQALAIAQEVGDRRGEGAHLGNLGNAYRDQGEVEKARDCWRQSLIIFEEIKDPNAERVRQWLADLQEE